MPSVEVHEAEDWAAVYIDGKLDRVGDAYLADERIREMFGVRTVQDDAFMRGSTRRDDVAKTLDEVLAYAEEREEKARRAAELRHQAEKLQREADALLRGER